MSEERSDDGAHGGAKSGGGRRGDLVRRVGIAVPWIAFAVFIVYMGRWVFAAAVFVFGVLALDELFRILRATRPAALAAYAGLAGLVLAAYFGNQHWMILALPGTLLVAFLITMARRDRTAVTLSLAVTVFGVVWIGLGIAHAVMLRELPHGGGLLAAVLAATFGSDTFAYLGGRLFGRHKLAPRISPGKTWEGLAFGFGGAILVAWVAGLYQDWIPTWESVVLGAAVGAIAPLGDLFESLIKRDLRVKDSGRFFGAHGGVLDRIDAVLFTVIVGYYVARAFGFGP